MKISILYFDGCPNHPPVVEMARRIVAEHSLNAEVEEVEVAPDDVVRLRFFGSPTVQVDGVDIEPVARERMDYAISCRVYDTPDGLPPEETFLAALGISAPTPVKASGDRAGSSPQRSAALQGVDCDAKFNVSAGRGVAELAKQEDVAFEP